MMASPRYSFRGMHFTPIPGSDTRAIGSHTAKKAIRSERRNRRSHDPSAF